LKIILGLKISRDLTIQKIKIVMFKVLTRREFLKETISKTTVLGMASVGFGLGEEINLKELVQCKNCGSVNIFIKSYFSSLIFHKEPLYCHDCGTNLKTQDHDIECSHYWQCSKKDLDSKNGGDFPVCCQIPFPNHKHLKKTRKPDFSLNDLKF